MNREIKFRAWNIPNKMMYQNVQNGLLAENEKGQYVLGVSLGKLAKDSGTILMQFTGLKDRNGIEIYEGDIVKWGMFESSKEHWHRYAKVNINPDIQFEIIFYVDSDTNEKRKTDDSIFHYGRFAYKDTENNLEIIGNIYDNPNLLQPHCA